MKILQCCDEVETNMILWSQDCSDLVKVLHGCDKVGLQRSTGLKVRSRSLCTWENRDNFRITGSISKILGPERSP